MNAALARRVAQLEQKQAPERRRRYVFWDIDSGEPEPVAEPGEELTIYSWLPPGEEMAPTKGGTRAPPAQVARLARDKCPAPSRTSIEDRSLPD